MQIGLFDDAAQPASTPAHTGPFRAFCDGSCRGNPGPGGWGLVLQDAQSGRTLEEAFGGDSATTNNRMELQAAIETLMRVPEGAVLEVFTDSQYVCQGMASWLQGWKKRGWKTAGGEPVKNREYWQTLDGLAALRKVTFTWVKGHAGHAGNERADTLANQGTAQAAGD